MLVVLFAVLICLLHRSYAGVLQIEMYHGDERCVGADLDENDDVIFRVGASSKSEYAKEQFLVVTVS